MFYIHQTSCISPQQTFGQRNLDVIHEPVNNKLLAIEPQYENIPPGILRRMGKAVRMGVGAALPLIKHVDGAIDGIIIGTANGGMDDCIKFLNQIVQYDEGLLTPGNFVQSTANAIAAQIGLLTNNKGYNITHVHRGLSFENSILDAIMMLKENPGRQYLLGAVDEISAYNYNIDRLAGWFKTENMQGKDLYLQNSPGSIAGEGAAMFIVNSKRQNASASIQAISTLHTYNVEDLQQHLMKFLNKHLIPGEKIDLLLSGENGDNRDQPYYDCCESLFGANTTVARFKHLFGDFATASSIACWLAAQVLESQSLPSNMIKKSSSTHQYKRVLIYNNFKHIQHGFLLMSHPSL